MSDETLIRPEFDGLWSAVSLPSGPLSPGEGGGDLLDSVGGAGAGEGGLGQKKTMSKMEKVRRVLWWGCICVCFMYCAPALITRTSF